MSPETQPERSSTNLSLRDLPKTQRTAVIFLFILAIAIVVFWLWLIKAQINRPFAAGNSTTNGTVASSSDSVALLKETDTDKDGLSDYDEIYTYKTSPYLPDTDSDGISDKKEVEQGTDPNCPEGQNCQATETVATSSNETLTSTASSSAVETPSIDASKVSTSSLQQALSGQADAATLREMLISGGADKAALDKISDSDLLKSYQEVLNKNSATNSAQ